MSGRLSPSPLSSPGASAAISVGPSLSQTYSPYSPWPLSPSPAPWQLRVLSWVLPMLLTWIVLDGSLLTAHVLSNALAFLLLLPEGVLVATQNIWQRRPVRSFSTHVAIQMTGLMLSLLGGAAMLLHQHAKKAPHFVSLHSWFGVATVLSVEFGGLFGALGFSGILHLQPEQLAVVRFLHRITGRLALLLSTITMLLGLHVFDIHHPRHQGWKTYTAAIALGVQSVGMHSVLWHSLPISWHVGGPRHTAGDAVGGKSRGDGTTAHAVRVISSSGRY